MYVKRKISQLFLLLPFARKVDETFIYPYSEDKSQKREQIWSNLQKGILFEDTQQFISWDRRFNRLDRFKEKRRDSGDRTEWYFGKRKILDGYECHAEAMKWVWLPWRNRVSRISENLGFDKVGQKNFLELIDYLTDLLGEPTTIEMEKWGSFDLGDMQWINGRVMVRLEGFEMHCARYSLSIGLIDNLND